METNNNRNSTKALAIGLFLLMFAVKSFSQPTNYNCYLKNITLEDPKTITFEIWIEKTGTNALKLEGFQAGINFNYNGLANGGIITGAFVPGSADATLPAEQQSPVWEINQTSKQIRMGVRIATGTASTIPVPGGIRIGKMIMTNTVNFATASPNFVWSYAPGSGYTTQTIVACYVNGNPLGANITIPANHSVGNLLCNPSLNLKLFIEGYYIGGSMMRPVLHNCDNNYPNTNDCDYITVNLLDPTIFSVVESVQGILHVDGTCSVVFSAVPCGNYYVSICHKNALQTMSALPVSILGATNYDFSSAASQAYGSNMVEVSPGVWAFYSGDLDHNCSIDGSDFIVINTDIQNGVSGCVCTDINGDGVVDGSDLNVLQVNIQNGIGCALPVGVPSCAPCNLDDGNPCTVDIFNPLTGMVTHNPVAIDDGQICTIDKCDTLSGAITHEPKFTAAQLDDNNPCTIDYCDAITGLIVHQPIPGCTSSSVCCPDFILKDAIKICPPFPACCQTDSFQTNPNPCDTVAACKNTPHTYTVYPASSSFSYTWTIVGGTPSGFTGNPITVVWGSGSSGYIKVVIKGIGNYAACSDSIVQKICLIDGPDANFTFSPGSPVCKNSPINFTNATGGGSLYHWDFGDGTSSDLANPPAHKYATAGTYIVVFTATDMGSGISASGTLADTLIKPCGCRDTISKVIVVLNDIGPEIVSNCCDSCAEGTVCPGETSSFCSSITCTSYSWNVTGGTIIPPVNAKCIKVVWNNTYSVPTTVSLSTPGCTSCSGTTTMKVPVMYPNLPITGPVTLCVGSSGSYTLPSMPGTYYTWTVTGGTSTFNLADRNVATVNITFTSQGTFTVKCMYNNPLANCPSGTSTFTVNVLPVFSINSGAEKVCQGTTENYLANGIASWVVTPAGATVPVGNSNFKSITWNTPGTYTITATPSPGFFCNTNAVKVVEVFAKPILSNIGGPIFACPGKRYEYGVSSDKAGSPFTWSVTGGTGNVLSQFGSDEDSAVILLTGNGPWTINVFQTIEISPGVTCQSLPKTLVVNPYLAPTVTPGPLNVCVDDIINYSASGPTPPDGFNWTVSPSTQGTILSGQGTNTVSIRWHGPTGNATITASHCGGSGFTSVTVFDPPFVTAITVNGPKTYCDPSLPSGLILSVPPGFSYVWNGPAGAGIPPSTNTWSILNSLWATHTDYYFSVTISNTHCSITKGVFIQLQNCNGGPTPPLPSTCTFNFNTNPVCVNEPANFVAIPTSSGLSYAWSFGDGATSYKSPTQHSYSAPGTYLVSLNIEGCPNTVQHTIVVNPKPSCIISVNDTIFCPGETRMFTGCSGFSAYQWFRNGNTIAGAATQNYTASKQGEYWLEVTNSFGCKDTSNHIYIYKKAPPKAKIKIVGDDHFCVFPSSTVSFQLMSALNLNPCTYHWSSDGSAIFSPNHTTSSNVTGVTLTLPATLPVTYYFMLNVIDQVTGCTASDTICITFYEKPVLTIQSIPTLDICEGQDVTLTPTPNDPIKYNYQWNSGATTPVLTVSAPGFYSLTITDKTSGCSDTKDAGSIYPKPDLSLFPIGCDTFCGGNYPLYFPLPLHALAPYNTYNDAYASIQWYDNGNYSASIGTGQNFLFSPTALGTHHISVIVQNNYGCTDTAEVWCLYAKPCCDTVCEDFNNNQLNGWQADPFATNIGISLSNVGSQSGNSDFYIQTIDQAGASALMASVNFNQWCCGELCYDYRIFDDGDNASSYNVNPIFWVYNGTRGFAFVSNIIANENNGWHRVCAPIATCSIPDSGAAGYWTPVGGSTNADWIFVTTGITRLVFRTDYSAFQAERSGFDNVCFTPGSTHQMNAGADTSICSGESATLHAGGCNDNATWYSLASGQPQEIGHGQSIVVTPLTRTCYVVRCCISDSTCCCSTDTVCVNVFPPIFLVWPYAFVPVCFDSPAVFLDPSHVFVNVNNNSVPITSTNSNWYFTGTGVSGNYFTPMLPGTFTITLHYTNENGCTDSITNSIYVQDCHARINIKALIQGYYIGGGQMTPAIFNELIPGATEAMVDTVTIEARDVIDFSLVDSYKAVIDTGGHVTGTFSVASIGTSYYLGIRHRNSLFTCTASPVLLQTLTSYDFRLSSNSAFGSPYINGFPYYQLYNFGDGYFGIYSGDVNYDEYIDTGDVTTVDNDNISGLYSPGGYWISDINGDGYVDTGDVTPADNNNLVGIFSQHP